MQNMRWEQQQRLLPGSVEMQKCITVDVEDGRGLTGHLVSIDEQPVISEFFAHGINKLRWLKKQI